MPMELTHIPIDRQSSSYFANVADGVKVKDYPMDVVTKLILDMCIVHNLSGWLWLYNHNKSREIEKA
jgi:hypothetical protein